MSSPSPVTRLPGPFRSSSPGIRELQPAPGCGIGPESRSPQAGGRVLESLPSPLSPNRTQSSPPRELDQPLHPLRASEVPVLCLQVIVMSGHETIRVLEVGVDAQISAEEEGKGLEGVAAEGSQNRGPGEASEPAGEAGPDNPDSSAEATGTRPSLPSGTALPESLPLAPWRASMNPGPRQPLGLVFLSSGQPLATPIHLLSC